MQMSLIPKKLIYLDVTVDFCVSNIQKRNRKSENDDSLKLYVYLVLLKSSFEKSLMDHRRTHDGDSVIYITETSREERAKIVKSLL